MLHQKLQPGPISVTGIVHTIRTGRKHTFLMVGYGLDLIQVVAATAKLPPCTLRSYIKVAGRLEKLPEGVYSVLPFEIVDATVTVLSLAAEETTSLCPSSASSDVRLAQRHHYFRDPEFIFIMRLSAKLSEAFRLYFRDVRITEIIPPMFTGMECEGGATLFKVTHPGKDTKHPMSAFLTQSSQFALEEVLPGLGDVGCIAPSFRAEDSHTRRHLTEFTHVETEWGGILTFEQHLSKLRELLKVSIGHFLALGETELIALGVLERVKSILASCDDILVLSHSEAIARLHEYGIEKAPGVPFGPRDDIPEAQERQLIDKMDRIVFLTKFPGEFKSFYMALDPEDPSRVLGCDVEVPGVGEIIGSGVRETSYDRLLSRLKEAGLDPADYTEYLDLRRCGFCFTSGMGLGLGRMLCWLLDRPSIRDVTAFPRFPGHLRP